MSLACGFSDSHFCPKFLPLGQLWIPGTKRDLISAMRNRYHLHGQVLRQNGLESKCLLAMLERREYGKTEGHRKQQILKSQGKFHNY